MNYPEENIQDTEHGECLQLHNLVTYLTAYLFCFVEKWLETGIEWRLQFLGSSRHLRSLSLQRGGCLIPSVGDRLQQVGEFAMIGGDL